MNRSFYKPKCRRSIHETSTTKESSISTASNTRSNAYSLRFLEYGFTYIGPVECPKPKCLICYHVLSNNQMTPEHLQAHLSAKHKEYRNKPRQFFEKQLDKWEKAQNRIQRSTSMDWSVEDIEPSPSVPTFTRQNSSIKPATPTRKSINRIPSPSVTAMPRLNSPIKPATPTRKSINRQYSEEYLKFGFTYIGENTAKPKPKCLLCYEMLPNSSMHKSALRDHLASKHAEYMEKPIEFFAKQLEKIEKAKTKSRRSLGGITALETISTPPKKIVPVKSTTPKKSSTQLYSEEFLKFGFTYTGDEAKPNPKCLLCYEILPNTSMRESALYHHFESKHNEYIDHPIEYFERQLENLEKTVTKYRRSTVYNNAPVAQVEPIQKSQSPKKSSATAARKSTPGRKSIGQKYFDEFLKFGFTYIGDETKPKPKCLLCYEVLSNSCMQETSLQEHLTSKHKEYTNKPVEFFAKQLNKYLKSQGRPGHQ